MRERQSARVVVDRTNNIIYAQITLDGPPAFHDTRRHTVAGKGAFARIVDNIEVAARHRG